MIIIDYTATPADRESFRRELSEFLDSHDRFYANLVIPFSETNSATYDCGELHAKLLSAPPLRDRLSEYYLCSYAAKNSTTTSLNVISFTGPEGGAVLTSSGPNDAIESNFDFFLSNEDFYLSEDKAASAHSFINSVSWCNDKCHRICLKPQDNKSTRAYNISSGACLDCSRDVIGLSRDETISYESIPSSVSVAKGSKPTIAHAAAYYVGICLSVSIATSHLIRIARSPDAGPTWTDFNSLLAVFIMSLEILLVISARDKDALNKDAESYMVDILGCVCLWLDRAALLFTPIFNIMKAFSDKCAFASGLSLATIGCALDLVLSYKIYQSNENRHSLYAILRISIVRPISTCLFIVILLLSAVVVSIRDKSLQVLKPGLLKTNAGSGIVSCVLVRTFEQALGTTHWIFTDKNDVARFVDCNAKLLVRAIVPIIVRRSIQEPSSTGECTCELESLASELYHVRNSEERG